MQENILRILSNYSITDEEDIKEALECSNQPEKWEKFIEEYIPQHLHKEIREKLILAKILSPNQQPSKNLIDEAHKYIDEVQINLSRIGVLPIAQYKWSEKLIDDIQVTTKKIIVESLNKSSSLNQFFKSEINVIFDLISRKGDLKDYFDELKLSNQEVKEKNQLSKLIKQMTFADFTIFLIKFVQQKSIIGSILINLAIPVPVLYQASDIILINPSLCKDIFGVQEYSLILNVGSKKTSRCGKSSFIAKLMTLQERYIYSNHFRNTLNLYTKLSFARNENTMLADFNGTFQKQLDPQIYEAIVNFAFHASLLIIHIHESQLLDKILQTKEYILLCSKAPKILIYVRDLQKTSLKILSRYIPQYMKERTLLRGLRNFKTYQMQMEQKEQLTFLCNSSYNILNGTKITVKNIINEHQQQKLREYEGIIEEAIRDLYSKHYSKESIIPNICKTEELADIVIRIRQESKSVERMNQYQQRQRELNLELKKPILTPFIKKAIQIINFDGSCHQMFAQRLFEWKKEKTDPLREEFLRLTEKLHQKQYNAEQTRKEILQNEQKRSHFQISVDKIMNEIIIYNQQAKNNELSEIIAKFYNDNISNVSPINIIDGKTLQFGNYVLEELLGQISGRYAKQNKKVYVISVIGAQSSAKSTLLNFLFRCKFETSAGRCTKGVYMSLCEMEDLVIVVLDTEGLLSVSERDVAFDHQIATFVLKISNLIIINNKGELTSTLKQMLEVCLYVLQCLHKDQKKTEYNPKKIIFALRDQTKPKGKFQEQMAAQIKNSLQQMKNTENLDYRNFFSIETDDILSLPNAFIEVNGLISKTGTMTIFDRIFEKCIIGMRMRIVDSLKSQAPLFNLTQFYNEASRVWETIQKCGKQIMNFKSIHQILSKRRLEEKFQQQQCEFESIIETSYDEYFNKINEVKPSTELEKILYSEQLLSIRGKNYGILAQLFQSSCDDCMNKEWIKEFLPKIQRLCTLYESSSWEKFMKKIKKLKNQEKDTQLKEKLYGIIKNLIQQNYSQEMSIKKFRNETVLLLNELKEEKQNINKTKLELEVKQVLQNILNISKYGELKINHIEQCETKYKRVNLKSNYRSLITIKWENFINSNDDMKLKAINNKVNFNFENKVREYIRAKNITIPSDIQNNGQDFLIIINNAIGYMTKQIEHLNKTYQLTDIHLNQPLYRIYLFGKFYNVVKTQMYEITLRHSEEEYLKYEKNMAKYENDLKKIIEYKGNFKQTLKNDVSVFRKELIQKKLESLKQFLEDSVNKLSLRLKPENIFSKALNETLLNNAITNKKHHYIQCFKLIKNINHYLFQVMCQYPEIASRSATILDATSQIIAQTKDYLIKFIKNLESLVDIESSQPDIKQLLASYNMIGIANFETRDLNMLTIAQIVIKSLREETQPTIDEITNRINEMDSENMIVSYITTLLKDKVIGCQFCCPICGMKCMLPCLHEGNHHVLENCHSLTAFSGISYQYLKEPVLLVCQEKANICCQWKSGVLIFDNLKLLIDKVYPNWSNQFPNIDEESRFQKFHEAVSLKRIWANIQHVIIMTKYKSVIPSSQQEIKKLRDESQLSIQDLEVEYERPLTKRKYLLKDY